MQQKKTKSIALSQGSEESTLSRQFKNLIVSQKLAPGTKVTENGLADLLSTSRTVARSLMEQLTLQEFLVSSSSRMTHVSPLTVTSIKENFLLRKMILPELISMSISSADINAMSELNKKIVAINVNKNDDDQVLKLLRLNREYNLAFLAGSKYRQPMRWAISLEDIAMRIYWIYVKQHGQLPFAASQHEVLLKAKPEDDPKRIQSTVLKVLNKSEKTILSTIYALDDFDSQDLIV